MPKLGKNERYYQSDTNKTYTLLVYRCLKSIEPFKWGHKALILMKFLYSKKIFERFTKEYLIDFTVFMENELYQPTKRDLWDFFYDGDDSYGYFIR